MAARRRGWLWLFAGLIFAFLAALVAMAAVEVRVQQEAAATPAKELAQSEPVAPVVVAAAHISMTKAIKEGDVNLQEWPVDIIPEGAATVIDDVIGKVAMADIYPGEVVLSVRLADPDITSENIAFTMPTDKVVFALPPKDLMSNIDLLRPGDVVDILFSLKPEADAKATPVPVRGEEAPVILGDPLFTTDALQAQRITAIVLEAPQVLPQQAGREVTGPVVEPAAQQPKAILLALDPQDALILKYFLDAGGIMDIVLRHRTNEELFEVKTVNYDYIKDLYSLPSGPLGPGQ
ncbi:MAG: Flp pilus assembly protein CpaB [Anaerolineae bacterium]